MGEKEDDMVVIVVGLVWAAGKILCKCRQLKGKYQVVVRQQVFLEVSE